MATKLFSGVDATNSNPFLASTTVANPFGDGIATPAERGATGYALVTSGPAVEASEVENAERSGVEVSIGWGTTVLHVAHLSPPRSFAVGDDAACDFQLPASKLGTSAASLVVVEQGQTFAVLLAGAQGWVELPGVGRLTIEQARERGQASGDGTVRLALPTGARVRQQVGDLVLIVGAGAAGKKSRRALFGAASATALMFAGLSMVGHLSVLGGLAFLQPSLGSVDDEESRRDQLVLMQQFLKAAAERNEEKIEEPTTNPDTGAGQGSGAMAKDTSGTMGSTTAAHTSGRFANKGRADNATPQLSREQQRDEASRFGMIGLLQALPGGDSRGPVAPWGQDGAEGRDTLSANGNMWGASIDDSAGAGGLGLHGIGSGGGLYEGVGTGKVATVFGGSGTCNGGPCNGFGTSNGPVGGTHKISAPSVRPSTPTVSGRLPPEIIQRIVRQSFGRFRLCYENGLRSNPNLQGRVAVRFVIDRGGRVASASNGGSDLPDSAVVSCVVGAFSGLSFPEPENGIVSVTYPISFAPGS